MKSIFPIAEAQAIPAPPIRPASMMLNPEVLRAAHWFDGTVSEQDMSDLAARMNVPLMVPRQTWTPPRPAPVSLLCQRERESLQLQIRVAEHTVAETLRVAGVQSRRLEELRGRLALFNEESV